MTTPRLLLLTALTGCAVVAGCSSERPSAPSSVLPTAPTAGREPFVDPATARFGTMALSLPSPEDALIFRQVLEAKLRAEGRPLQTTFVNPEGVIVWTLEYLRYRSSGCSQSDAIDRVFAQIDRRGVPPVCGTASGTLELPPQNESLAFRQALEIKYRDDLGAPPLQTYIDLQSDIVYTLEFVRYTQSGCSGAESYERVFVQIDGRGVPPDCQPPTPPAACTFTLTPSPQTASAAGATITATVTAQPESCRWQIAADVPWISGAQRAGFGTQGFTYTVAANDGAQPRSGRISLRGDDDGRATIDVNQGPSAAPPPPPPPPPPPTPPTPPTPPPMPPAPTCVYTFSPTVVSVPAAGGDFTVQISTGSGCTWIAESSTGFIRVIDNVTGAGGGTVRFSVTTNTGPARTASASIGWPTGRQTIEVRQAAAPLKAIIKSPLLCDVFGESCIFDGSGSQGAISAYEWDFGDGGDGSADPSTTAPIVDYSYDSSWFFSFETEFVPVVVKLTVYGPAGSDSTTVTINVYASDFLLR